MVKRVDALYECFKTQTKIKYFVKKLTQIVFVVIKTLNVVFGVLRRVSKQCASKMKGHIISNVIKSHFCYRVTEIRQFLIK
jgi:uncharacterized protein YaaW (UPF0174 family)